VRSVLLDTNLLIWFLYTPEHLGATLERELTNDASTFSFSLASIWEIGIKFALQRRDFTAHPKQVRDKLLELGFEETPISAQHLYKTTLLPKVHRDPFDRLLVAQSIVEKKKLWTSDKTLAGYGRHVRVFG
jgi:PIN domain nuclease of toxin-antitoxin system